MENCWKNQNFNKYLEIESYEYGFEGKFQKNQSKFWKLYYKEFYF